MSIFLIVVKVSFGVSVCADAHGKSSGWSNLQKTVRFDLLNPGNKGKVVTTC